MKNKRYYSKDKHCQCGKLIADKSTKCWECYLRTRPKHIGQFQKGIIPWNKGMKGLRLSPKSEFKKGRISIFKGKHHSNETKEKLSFLAKERYKVPKDNPNWRGGIEKAKERERIHERERYQEDYNFKLRKRLRSRVRLALKKNLKSDSMLNLLGCSISTLRKHLEKQFRPGMTWDNHTFRGWHIDHIKPCASFDLSKPEEQRKCFHYTNLQPLWASENMVKNDNYSINRE